MSESTPDPVEVILGYHERTKHHPGRYARSLGYLDWNSQPDPFRRFDGAPQYLLDEVPVTDEPAYDALFSHERLPEKPFDRASLSQLFYDSLALSAWKEYGTNRWSLRVNPSSGNLHPTEGYLLCGPIPGVRDEPGLYHYAPFTHALELRREWSREVWDSLHLPEGSFLLALSSIHWRESWKYGERAFRYCQHDVGHAIAAIGIGAAALGWKTKLIESMPDSTLAQILGIDTQSGPEAEHPDVLILVSSGDVDWTPPASIESLLTPLLGTPNQLSSEHQEWEIIDVAAEASRKETAPHFERHATPHASTMPSRRVSARQMIRQRRSAVSMDGITSITRETFFRMLEHLSPSANGTVFDPLPWQPAVHLAIFVHRVEGLEPGLYFLLRDSGALPSLRSKTRPEFEWQRVKSPETIELYRLKASDAEHAARFVSCQQEIASDGAFALGMIAHFEPTIRQQGAWFWRRLHWEAGAIGQVLYLEAEAAGVRGTGIGCFFDDVMHNVLGFENATFHTIYHFTVGGPVEDARLRTAPPYAHRSPTAR